MTSKKAVCIILFIWIASAVAFFWPVSPPIEFYGENDSVAPSQVFSGSTFTVRRTFRITRTEEIHVNRRMIKGDCNYSCEVVDLPSTTKVYTLGEYVNMGRDHQVPVSIHPGKWRLVFTFTWQTRFRVRKEVLAPVLEIEVLPNK